MFIISDNSGSLAILNVDKWNENREIYIMKVLFLLLIQNFFKSAEFVKAFSRMIKGPKQALGYANSETSRILSISPENSW